LTNRSVYANHLSKHPETESAMSDTILSRRTDDWVEITLNRPDRLNAFNDEMHAALRAALEAARDGGARAVLLTGAGRGFCAGQDLGDRDPRRMGGPPDLGHTLRTFYNPLIRLIRAFDAPVVCAVNGVAAGAGANLALACDIVLAGESARFIQSFAKVGLVPDAGGSWSLPRLLGEARAKALALTAEPLPAATAADWGLIWKALPDDALMAEARALTGRLAAGPTAGLAAAKHAIQAAAVHTLDQQLDLEAALQKACGEGPDYAEGVAAFLEKRTPVFTGGKP
jgi:2-(1,2-epoxy-1,2-dihydrophenyl)acetyl-CoA isomerase